MLCFQCGKFGNTREGCAAHQEKKIIGANAAYETNGQQPVELPGYGLWMQVSHTARGRKNTLKATG